MNTATTSTKRTSAAPTATEIGFDLTHNRTGWALTTYIAEDSETFGSFLHVLENVPLSVAEAVNKFPHLVSGSFPKRNSMCSG